MSEPTPSAAPAGPGQPMTGVSRTLAYGLVLVLTVELTGWGAFLVPFRVGGSLVPVSWFIVLVGNVAVGYAGGRLAGKTGALVPGLLWLVLAFTLGSTRAEGDLVVPGSTVGMGFLLVGALASAVAYVVVVTRLPARD